MVSAPLGLDCTQHANLFLYPGWSTAPDTAVMGSDRNPGTLFSLILWALGTAHARPTEIQVILRKRDTLVPHAFRINTIHAPVISGLKTLFLNLHADNTSNSAEEGPLRRFLHTSTDLEVLRLNFDSRWSAASKLLDWLGTPPAATDLSLNKINLVDIPPAPLSNLTTLEIGMATVSGSSLARALSRFQLKSFSLWRITLADRDASQLHADHWAQFLKTLSKALGVSGSIQKIIIGLMAQITLRGTVSASWEKVQLCPEGTTDKSKVKDDEVQKEAKFRARYGLSASDWLEALSERTYVRSIHAPPSSPSSPDSDSEGTEEYQSDDDNDHDGESEDNSTGDED